MARWLVMLFLNGAALLYISSWFPSIYLANMVVAMWAALVLGVVNTVVRPILLLMSLPIRMMTFGLFWFVINAATFALTAYFIDGFELGEWPGNIGTVIAAAALMSIAGWLIDRVFGKK
ncbi:phage holin family protein [Brevibacillus sp. TJ4]|uniref:phage holin family protein n=1 Tax=Brevibacillus sp. TJ4 TaxID=3234853 RepID=UPI0037D13021